MRYPVLLLITHNKIVSTMLWYNVCKTRQIKQLYNYSIKNSMSEAKI